MGGGRGRTAANRLAEWGSLMAITVGRVVQLSFEPFYIDMERRGVLLRDCGFGQVAEALRSGDLDSGPVPLTDSFEMEDCAVPVAGFCLSAAARSGSNLLYSRSPIEEQTAPKVAAADADETTIRLLQVLLAEKYGIGGAQFVAAGEEHDALLLSGDAALRRRRGLRGYPHRYDLGEEWHRMTDLPFVFARWMARRGLEQRDSMLLEDTLYVGLEEGVDSLFHLSEPRENLLMLARDVVEYIIGYRYFIGLSERKSIDLFRSYCNKLAGA